MLDDIVIIEYVLNHCAQQHKQPNAVRLHSIPLHRGKSRQIYKTVIRGPFESKVRSVMGKQHKKTTEKLFQALVIERNFHQLQGVSQIIYIFKKRTYFHLSMTGV